MNTTPSPVEQRAFVRGSCNDRTSDEPEKMEDEKKNWDFEGVVSAEQVVTAAVRGTFWEGERVCEDVGETSPKTNVKVINLAGEGVKPKCRKATLSDQNTIIEAEFVEARAA